MSLQPTQDVEREPLDLEAVRGRLKEARGAQFWQSLEELADSREFRNYLEDEFPQQMRPINGVMDRRTFVKLAGASLALAGLTGCIRQPEEKLVPHVKAPEEYLPGRPLFYASAMPTRNGYGEGVLVESYDGRPIKVEGNPQHPATVGRSNVWMQASVLSLYDPDRSQAVQRLGDVASWDAFVRALTPVLREQRRARGAGLRILTGTVTSPTLAAQMRTLLARYPLARWHVHDPAGGDAAREGAEQAFGQPVNTVYRFDRARVIVSLDSDFLLRSHANVRYGREFIEGRRVRLNRTQMNRLYVVESTPTITGAMADHRLPVRPSEVEAIARALAAALGAGGNAGAAPASVPADWMQELVADLRANRGAGLIVAGEEQPAAVHALAHAMNQTLGNVNRTVLYTEPVEARPAGAGGGLRELAEAMDRGEVQALIILGANPAYTAPAELDFAKRMVATGPNKQEKVPLRVHLGMYNDETGVLCHWHIPESHYLEAWGDVRAYDGTASIIQPLIAPLYESRSPYEVVGALLEQPQPGYDLVRGYWRAQRRGLPDAQFETFWRTVLHDGVIPNTAARRRQVAVTPAFLAGLATAPAAPAPAAGELEIVFRTDPTIWDGRFANNGWLQELPKPFTKLVWENAAYMSLDTAQRLGLTNEDMVELTYQGRKVTAPAWIVPGQPNDVITADLGYGRWNAGQVGSGLGFNAYALRTVDAPGFGRGLQIRRADGRAKLATTEFHNIINTRDAKLDGRTGRDLDTMHDRDIVRVATIQEFRDKRGKVGPETHHGPDTQTEAPHGGAAPTHDRAEAEARGQALPPGHQPEGQKPGAEHDPGETHAGEGDTRPADWYRKDWEYKKRESYVNELGQPSMYPEFDYSEFAKWGMTIDSNACIGCNACVIACQAENNIPVVGKREVMRGREMHWIRIDRYHKGDVGNPETYFQPMLCQHCEKAPCEPVCPVAATVHSHEGLNMQIYNRCIGTRYCSNNCPYKVRRFNFFKYTAYMEEQPVFRMLNNPNVTVRGRGVMEKCTYCVQRINYARIEAKKQNRPIRDGEVVTACQAACPTEAIVFGNLNDEKSVVAQTKAEPHVYNVLEEIGTQPRTSYMPRLRNPNPALEAPAAAGPHEDHGMGDPT